MSLMLRLYLEFFKVGLFSVGGGMATIPFLNDLADSTGWFTRAQLADMIAVGESTPGPIGVNMATYVGFLTGSGGSGSMAAGILGAAVATLGLITPSVIVILIIARVLKAFRSNVYVERCFYGLRPASTGLIAAAGLSVAVTTLWPGKALSFAAVNWKGCVLALALWFFSARFSKTKGLHPILFIAAAALAGIIFSL